MGRKRKRRRTPLPSIATQSSLIPEPQRHQAHSGKSSTQVNGSLRRHEVSSLTRERCQLNRPEASRNAGPTVPTTHRILSSTSSGSRGVAAVPNPSAVTDGFFSRRKTVSASHNKPQELRRSPPDSSSSSSHFKEHAGSMRPSEVLARLLPEGGWKLASCWADDCGCTAFTGRGTAGSSTRAAAFCCCGHRAVAHELVDSSLPAMDESKALGMLLRKLFAAIRNIRALGDCDLFQDSTGVGGWGCGWFLSRLGRRYLQRSRQAIAELDGAIHDSPAIERSLSTVEAFMSGNAPKEWAVPGSLPSKAVYKTFGTGIASALDEAYFHVRYSAATRFDIDGVTAGAAGVVAVVPPPEVYFLCLAFHVPSKTDLLSMPGIDNPALRSMLTQVFDVRLDVEGFHCEAPSRSAGGNLHDELHFPVLENPLLAVTQSTWLEVAVSGAPRTWVPFFPPRFGELEGTMRGSDPALPHPIRARCDATRDWLARLYAFAVPNERAVEACQRAVKACGEGGTGIVEVGAGLGYWKWVLENAVAEKGGTSLAPRRPSEGNYSARVRRGAPASNANTEAMNPLRVLAIDKDPARLPSSAGQRRSTNIDEERRGRARAGGRRGQKKGNARAGRVERLNEYHGGAPAWTSVLEGDPKMLQSLSAGDFPALLLCYPPPLISSGGACVGRLSCMGTDALGYFSGNVVLYVGEIGGDTGSLRLEEALCAGWDMVEEVELPCFSSTTNRLMVFIRKGYILPRGRAKGATKEVTGGKKRAGARSDADEVVSMAEPAGAWSSPLAMYRCVRCGEIGREGSPLRLCRLTRAATYCSERCFVADGERWRASLHARHVHVAEAVFRSGGIFRNKKLFKRLAVRMALDPS